MNIASGCAADSLDAVRVGVRFEPDWPPGELVGFAGEVEEMGYDELWFSEDCFWSGGVSLAGAALAVTTRIGVGVGLFATPVRNPATAAMEIATLGEIAPSRFTASFGHGNPEWMQQIGADTSTRLPLLEETVSAVRGLLHGETVNMSTPRIRLDDVRLAIPPRIPPPVLVGSTGPIGLAVARRSADGVVLPELTTPAALRWVQSELARNGGIGSVVVFAFLSLDDDSATAAAAIEPGVARLARSGLMPRFAEFAGVDARSTGRLDETTVQAVGVAGDAGRCLRALREWERLGVDSLVLVPRAHDGPAQVTRFAREVLPAFRQS